METLPKPLRAILTPIILILLLLLLLGSAYWGFKEVTRPAPTPTPEPCVDQKVGKALTPKMVQVRVQNGGYTTGLALRVSAKLRKQGFKVSRPSNTDERVKQTIIVGASKDSPEVKLVAGYFKAAVIRADQRVDHSVDVLVGSDYAGFNKKAPKQVPVPGGTACLPKEPSPTPTPNEGG